DQDGNKNFAAKLSGWLFGFGDISASGSWDLPTIPRNSQVSTDKTSYTLGEPITIITNRKSTTFTHRIRIRLNNAGGTLLKEINNVGSSTVWTPTSGEIEMMQNAIPNSNTLNLYIESFNNQVGQSTNVTRVQNLTDANPTFSD